MRRGAIACALLALLAIVGGCRHRGEPGTNEETIVSGGRTRSFLYRTPPGQDASRRSPLVVVLHGRGGQGESAESVGHVSAIADREGFVVAYPDGFRRSWNDLRGVTPASRRDVDDVGFLRDVIDWLIVHASVDPRRVYVAGASNGGFMALRVACEMADRIAAIGVVIATMPDVACAPSRPMPIAFLNGTEDPLVDDEGSDGDLLRGGPPLLSSEASRDRWAALNGCDEREPLETSRIDPADDGTYVERTAKRRCRDDAASVLFTVHGGGHTWPGGEQYLPVAVIGRTSRDLDAGEELWAFFRDRARGE